MIIEKAPSPDLSRVVSDPEICGGRPVIRGTRMRVVDILDMLAEGVTPREILDDFDYLTEADLFAALAYAAAAVGERTVRAA